MAQQAGYAIPSTTSVVIEEKREVLTGCRTSTDAATDSLGDFDKLPAEVRNEIYKLALTAPSVILIKRHQDRPPGSSKHTFAMKICGTFLTRKRKQKRRVSCVKGTGIGLLRASRFINTEAAPIFYHNNSFQFVHRGALNIFLNYLNEMTLFLSDIDISRIDLYEYFFSADVLTRLRISSEPRSITLRPSCNRSNPSAEFCARSTWRTANPFVKRRGEDVFYSKAFTTLRAHMHTVKDGEHPKCSYPALTADDELKRLQALSFSVPRWLIFQRLGTSSYGEIMNPIARRQRFEEMLRGLWREDRLREERGDGSEEEGEDLGVSDTETENEGDSDDYDEF